jgi:hypothetical protein
MRPGFADTTRRSPRLTLVAVWLGLLSVACETPDPQQELELLDFETHWAIDRSVGGTNHLAPVVRFRLRNKGTEPRRSIQVKVNFRRGDEAVWSVGFEQVSPVAGQPLAPGASIECVLKPDGEGRYSSPESPKTMLEHEAFKDVRAEVFVRLGRASWVKMAEVEVERRIGSRTVEGL